MPKTEWSAKDDNRLRLFYEAWEGEVIPINSIAEALKRTPSAVRIRANKLGLTEPNRPRAARGREPANATRTCAKCGDEFKLRSPSSPQQTCGRSCAAKLRAPGFKSRSRMGKYNGQMYRSGWERNVARYLDHLVDEGTVAYWGYEVERFQFPVKRGNRSYLPDFKVFYPDGTYEWWEVKGYMDNDSKIKLKRFALHHTEESLKLKLIDRPAYHKIRDEFGAILEGWEQ